ncbi:MAG: hypothetical protein KF729_04340 [Sandaracinaceae bacterium]|nr:hypothetical protein [Sandaracinaceae bacterium]
MRARLAPWLAVALAACAPAPTQVMVHVDAEPGVREMTRSIQIRIWGRARDGTFATEPDVIEPVAGPLYVWRVSLHPLANDGSRFFRLEAAAYPTANATGAPVALARLQSSYVDGQTVHLYLLIQDSCIGVPCEDLDSTCIGARCVPIPEPTPFDPEQGYPRDGGVMDAATRDAGVPLDAGRDAFVPDGCVAAEEACNRRDDDCDGEVDEDFDLDGSLEHCGMCNTPCTVPNATPACVDGVCGVGVCNAGFGDCVEATPGCETPLSTATNCGECGRACTGGLFCAPQAAGYRCVASCDAPLTACMGSCVEVGRDPLHCDGCGAACPSVPNATATCSGGICGFTCLPGFEDCDGVASNGCERNLRGDLAHCGACDRACAPRACNARSCEAGICTYTPDDLRTCDDGIACTTNACMGGICTVTGDACGMDDGGTPECVLSTDCPDMGPCSDDQCFGGTCFHTPLPHPCCTSVGECDDANACTTDACDANQCTSTAIAGCTSCFGGPDCVDSDPCTEDRCVLGRCEHTPIPGCNACMTTGCSGATPQCCEDSGGYCCGAGATCCMGACCGAGATCCGGTCCPSGACCGASCCGAGFTCCDGITCCPVGDACMAGACIPPDGGAGGFDAGVGFDAGLDAGVGLDAGFDAGGHDAGPLVMVDGGVGMDLPDF